jgi:hypothetical protein
LPPPVAVGLALGVGYRLPPAAREVPPAAGFTLATFAGYRYAVMSQRLALGLAVAFAFQRYTRSFESLAPAVGTYTRDLSIGDFVVMQTAGLLLGRARPFAAAGAGLSLGHFRSPQDAARPDEERETLVVVQGQVGIDVEVKPQTDVGLRADVVVPLARPTLRTSSGDELRVFGPRLALRLALQYRF